MFAKHRGNGIVCTIVVRVVRLVEPFDERAVWPKPFGESAILLIITTNLKRTSKISEEVQKFRKLLRIRTQYSQTRTIDERTGFKFWRPAVRTVASRPTGLQSVRQ